MNIDFDPNIDFYKVLGVDPKASAVDIKKAFRKLAKQNHPDSTGGDKKKEVRFKEINTAYEVLGDARKRAQYDEIRDQVRSGGFRSSRGGGGPFPGNPFAGPGGPGNNVHDLSDVFAQFFSGAGGGGGGRGAGVRIDVDDDAAWQSLGGPRRRAGRPGARHGSSQPPQPEPELESKLRAPDGSWLTVKGGHIHSDARLPFQDAILGTVLDVTTIDGTSKVKIPPGTSSGQRLRLRGKGVVGPTGEAGDHYVTIQIDVPRDLDDADRKRLIDFVSHLKKAPK